MASKIKLNEVVLTSPNGLVEKVISINNDGLITLDIPPGAVQLFAMNTAPAGWLKANGQAVSRVTYANLFNAIGTLYGVGDGSTTFNLPDLRGEFIRGFDDGRGVDSGRVFGTSQVDAFQKHQHQVYKDSSGSYTASINIPAGTTNGYQEGGVVQTRATGYVADGGGEPRTANETRPRNIALLYCIKY